MSGILCVITARGGSKRIPHKNIRDFCGKPIIAYSIEAALASELFDEVMVSTDDEEISKIATRCGANVPFLRSPETSNDYATTADVLIEVLDEYRKRGQTFDTLCCLYPTAPFVTGQKLKDAYRLYGGADADSLLTVTRFSFPPQRGFVKENGCLMWWMPEYERARSQDLDPVFHDAGQFYLRDANALVETKSLVGDRCVGYEVPETEVQDIDNESDWQIAEMKFESMMNHGKTTG